MASEMLEKILDAEKSADEKAEAAKREVKRILDEANAKANEIIASAKKGVALERQEALAKCKEQAESLVSDRKREAEDICNGMKKTSSQKMSECALVLENKLFS